MTEANTQYTPVRNYIHQWDITGYTQCHILMDQNNINNTDACNIRSTGRKHSISTSQLQQNRATETHDARENHHHPYIQHIQSISDYTS